MTPYDVGCYNTERRYYHRIISSLPGLSTNLHAIVILKTAPPISGWEEFCDQFSLVSTVFA